METWLSDGFKNASASNPQLQQSASIGIFFTLYKNKTSWLLRRLIINNSIFLSYHEATIQYGFMFPTKSGITPVSEFPYFFRYQHADSFPQLFLKESCVKTHFGEYSFDII